MPAKQNNIQAACWFISMCLEVLGKQYWVGGLKVVQAAAQAKEYLRNIEWCVVITSDI